MAYYIAKYVQSKTEGSSSGALKVHIGSIMPKIPIALASKWTVPLNGALYNNAIDCRPAVALQTGLQNYATAMAPYEPFEKPKYKWLKDIQVESDSADVLTCRIRTVDIDNSND